MGLYPSSLPLGPHFTSGALVRPHLLKLPQKSPSAGPESVRTMLHSDHNGNSLKLLKTNEQIIE